jgi:hypothetical protein
MTAISVKNETLADDFRNHFTFGPEDFEFIDDRYFVADSFTFKYARNKGLVILDVHNRWAAFAMIHDQDFWHHRDGAICRTGTILKNSIKTYVR